jgi:DNA-directed RNA polymerase sigma subunit (sigma70/sigma32)
MLRYGLGCEALSPGEIGRRLGITRQRVHELERRALSKLGAAG